ncbi:MAG: hypothetical protein PWR02_1624, partial [Synergistales bacterium]|nr:hypothetical protein [Synergistales bacterium]
EVVEKEKLRLEEGMVKINNIDRNLESLRRG